MESVPLEYSDIFAVAAIALCTLLMFCLSLAETALVTISRTKLQGLAAAPGVEAGAAESGSMRWMVMEPTRVVATVQVGITAFGLISVAVAVAVLAPDLARALHRVGVAHYKFVAIAALALAVILVSLVVGQIVPRALALANPARAARLVSGPVRWIERIERPLVMTVLGLSNILLRPFAASASFQAPVITEEELRTILEASQKEGVIQEEEKEMLHNVISFGDTPIHKVMTPRVHVRAMEVQEPLTKLINLIVDHGHSRIPLYEGTIDSIIGVVHAKDLLPHLVGGRPIEALRQMMRAPFFVPEQMLTDELLEQMRRSNMQMAIVQDEYGGTAGLVTIEDLIEEIVGEIRDEYDVEQPMVSRDGSGAALVDARMAIDDVNDELGLTLPTTDFDTVGGLVFGLFGRPALVGDSIELLDPAAGEPAIRFTVTKADGHRLQELRIEPKSAASPAALVTETPGGTDEAPRGPALDGS